MKAEAKREAGGAGGGECDAGRRVVGANGELFEEAATFAGSRPNMVKSFPSYACARLSLPYCCVPVWVVGCQRFVHARMNLVSVAGFQNRGLRTRLLHR